jgi:3-hydroxyacyl-CoA dehydrogenase/enoyl-CoA hydratase/3-hydroxybutyryl-CoA epimerase
MPGKSMNVIDISVMDELDAIVDEVVGDDAVKGASSHPARKTFPAAPT